MPAELRTCLRAGVIAGLLSGVPSTVWALVRREDPLAATLAAGRMLRPDDSNRLRLIGAAATAHAALSLGWAPAIGLSSPRRASMPTAVLHGAMCGAAIAAVDLGAAHASSHARMAAIRSLLVLPQLADHVAYGVTVAAVMLTRNRRSAVPSRPLSLHSLINSRNGSPWQPRSTVDQRGDGC